MSQATIYVVSDSLGETAELVARAAASQFGEQMSVVRLPRIDKEERLDEAIAQARPTQGAALFFTFADPRLRNRLRQLADDAGIPSVDVLGPALSALECATGTVPEMRAGAMRQAGRSYERRIEALEFAVAHDDGKGTDALDEAEIVLVGVSRTSKTPLAMYLAYKGWRVANVPIVLGIEPPRQLFEIDKRKIVGLVADEKFLVEVRRQRLSELAGTRLGKGAGSEVIEELEYSRRIMRRLGCRVVNVTRHTIEETANQILKGIA
ncbi:MAG: kinase/pyrophosphorylase [Actinobacteria bacterium]|nr:MAG: kinase/pyrophosphorylase [Actinomycetota bacterium]